MTRLLTKLLRHGVLLLLTTSVYSWSVVSRRRAFLAGIGCWTTVATSPAPAHAATTPSREELARLQQGHARIRYLLLHWDTLTSNCGNRAISQTESKQVIRTEGGGGVGVCEKNPLVVQDYLGYKNVNDPLFKADKLMVRAAPLVDNDLEQYLEAVERYREKADQAAMMAYTSSWGEANPNGGKEVVDAYLERTKADAIETERILQQILGYLDLQVLPPSK